jgi:hypothetical protein
MCLFPTTNSEGKQTFLESLRDKMTKKKFSESFGLDESDHLKPKNIELGIGMFARNAQGEIICIAGAKVLFGNGQYFYESRTETMLPKGGSRKRDSVEGSLTILQNINDPRIIKNANINIKEIEGLKNREARNSDTTRIAQQLAQQLKNQGISVDPNNLDFALIEEENELVTFHRRTQAIVQEGQLPINTLLNDGNNGHRAFTDNGSLVNPIVEVTQLAKETDNDPRFINLEGQIVGILNTKLGDLFLEMKKQYLQTSTDTKPCLAMSSVPNTIRLFSHILDDLIRNLVPRNLREDLIPKLLPIRNYIFSNFIKIPENSHKTILIRENGEAFIISGRVQGGSFEIANYVEDPNLMKKPAALFQTLFFSVINSGKRNLLYSK